MIAKRGIGLLVLSLGCAWVLGRKAVDRARCLDRGGAWQSGLCAFEQQPLPRSSSRELQDPAPGVRDGALRICDWEIRFPSTYCSLFGKPWPNVQEDSGVLFDMCERERIDLLISPPYEVVVRDPTAGGNFVTRPIARYHSLTAQKVDPLSVPGWIELVASKGRRTPQVWKRERESAGDRRSGRAILRFTEMHVVAPHDEWAEVTYEELSLDERNRLLLVLSKTFAAPVSRTFGPERMPVETTEDCQ